MSHRDVAMNSFGPSGVTHVVQGALLRVALSVLIPVVWISLTLVYVAFFAAPFTFFQDVVIVVVSLLALLGSVTAMWVSFGLTLYHRWVDW
jgi:hypothetical protein